MATHSSIPAWRIPWTEEPGGLQSMGSQRVGQDWATNISLPLTLRVSAESCGKPGPFDLLTLCQGRLAYSPDLFYRPSSLIFKGHSNTVLGWAPGVSARTLNPKTRESSPSVQHPLLWRLMFRLCPPRLRPCILSISFQAFSPSYRRYKEAIPFNCFWS